MTDNTPPTDTTPAPDPVQDELDALRAQVAALDARAADPRTAEIASLKARLAPEPPPTVNAWSDIPRVADLTADQLAQLDPNVVAILNELKVARARNTELERLIASNGAPSRDASAAPDARLALACGHSVTESTSIPTHHHCPTCDATVRVLSGSLAE